jgi:type VI secretion system secreted protein Hcp
MPSAISQSARIGCLAILLAAAPATVAAFDAFLKIDDIPGESIDDAHRQWIDLLSFNTGIAGPASTAATRLTPLRLVKRLDKASPLLARACATGKPLGQVKLELVRSLPRRTRFYQITLDQVLVTRLETSGAVGEPTPDTTETLELTAAQLSWTYTEFDSRGEPIQDLVNAWDILRNEGSSDIIPAMRASGVQTTDGQIRLTFPAKPGVAYRVLGGSDLWSDFVEVHRLQPGDGGETTLHLPTSTPRAFFIVEELP